MKVTDIKEKNQEQKQMDAIFNNMLSVNMSKAANIEKPASLNISSKQNEVSCSSDFFNDCSSQNLESM